MLNTQKGWGWKRISGRVDLTRQVAGFVVDEPIVWLEGAAEECTRLLHNTIACTALALVLLLTVWFTGVLQPEGKAHREVA